MYIGSGGRSPLTGLTGTATGRTSLGAAGARAQLVELGNLLREARDGELRVRQGSSYTFEIVDHGSSDERERTYAALRDLVLDAYEQQHGSTHVTNLLDRYIDPGEKRVVTVRDSGDLLRALSDDSHDVDVSEEGDLDVSEEGQADATGAQGLQAETLHRKEQRGDVRQGRSDLFAPAVDGEGKLCKPYIDKVPRLPPSHWTTAVTASCDEKTGLLYTWVALDRRYHAPAHIDTGAAMFCIAREALPYLKHGEPKRIEDVEMVDRDQEHEVYRLDEVRIGGVYFWDVDGYAFPQGTAEPVTGATVMGLSVLDNFWTLFTPDKATLIPVQPSNRQEAFGAQLLAGAGATDRGRWIELAWEARRSGYILNAQVNHTQVPFRVDTGAEATCMSLDTALAAGLIGEDDWGDDWDTTTVQTDLDFGQFVLRDVSIDVRADFTHVCPVLGMAEIGGLYMVLGMKRLLIAPAF